MFSNQGGTAECPFVPEAKGLLVERRSKVNIEPTPFGWMTLVEKE